MNRRLLFYGLCIILLAGCSFGGTSSSTEIPPTIAPNSPRLVTAWVDAGTLVVWQQGDAAPRSIANGDVIQPYIAPDGATIAFTRGANGAPETLWTIDINGTNEQKLVGANHPAGYAEGQTQIGDVAWLNENVLYFNTLTQDVPAFKPLNDLYRADVTTRDVVQVLKPGEGGRIHVSPYKRHLALVFPGTYGESDGRIRVYDTAAQTAPVDLLEFVGVSTGSHYAFYPPVAWLPDSSAILTAIPDKDLLYSETDTAENVPDTVVWRLPLASPSEPTRLAHLKVSFFGLPRWSDDGSMMTYLQRTPKTNKFSIVLANQSGENPKSIATAEAGEIEQPAWIPGTNQFVYALGTGMVYIASRDADPTKLPDLAIYTPLFVSSDVYVFAAPADDSVQMRFAKIGDASQLIGTVARIPVFDARLILPVTS